MATHNGAFRLVGAAPEETLGPKPRDWQSVMDGNQNDCSLVLVDVIVDLGEGREFGMMKIVPPNSASITVK